MQFPEEEPLSTTRAGPDRSPSTLKLTKILHAIRVRVIQEEVATLDSPVYLKAESQTRILDQVRVYLLSDGLGPGENSHGHKSHSPGLRAILINQISCQFTLAKNNASFAIFPILTLPSFFFRILGPFQLASPFKEQG